MYNSDITALKARCKALEQEHAMLLRTMKGVEIDLDGVLRFSQEMNRLSQSILQIVQYIAQKDGVSESEVAFS